ALPLARNRMIQPKDILQYPLALYDTPVVIDIVACLAKRYGKVNILFTSSNIEMIQHAIREKLAITLVTQYEVGRVPLGIDMKIDHCDNVKLEQQYGMVLVSSKQTEEKDTVNALIKILS